MIKKRIIFNKEIHLLKKELRSFNLHTVCEQARCPNLCECFSKKTATFLIMGDICTRSCKFCSIKTGKPKKLDPLEPKNIALQSEKLGLKHVVITSVTRDDLPDKGAGHFVETIKEIQNLLPHITIEVLTPDFNLNINALESVFKAGPSVYNHNVETVERLTPKIRDKKAGYQKSIEVIKIINKIRHSTFDIRHSKIKSGLMLGLGETKEEVKQTITDLKQAGCDIITIGQYLQPTKIAIKVQKNVPLEEFDEYAKYGKKMGMTMYCGPFVRSSYNAEKVFRNQK